MYRAPHTTVDQAGPYTTYFQQWHMLRRQGRTAPNPRNQVLHDLESHLSKLYSSTTAIIIQIDANESYQDNHSTLLTWMQRNSLTDIHMYLNNIGPDIATYTRGTRRIDYMFATQNILPYIVQGGIFCLLYTSPSPRDGATSRMPSSA